MPIRHDNIAIRDVELIEVEALDDAELVLVDSLPDPTPSGRRLYPPPLQRWPAPLLPTERETEDGGYWCSIVRAMDISSRPAGRRRRARAAGAEVDIRRVAETAPEAVVKAAGFKTDTAHPLLGDPKQHTRL